MRVGAEVQLQREAVRQTLPRHERLRGYQIFSRLMGGAPSFSSGPLRCFVRVEPSENPGVVAGFAVSRSVRGSVARNRVRRLMREAYRLQRRGLGEAVAARRKRVHLAVLFMGGGATERGHLRRTDLDSSMLDLLQKISRRL